MKRLIFFASCALFAHFFFYAFTGLALWAPISSPEDVMRGVGLVAAHALAAIGAIFNNPSTWGKS